MWDSCAVERADMEKTVGRVDEPAALRDANEE